MKLAQEKFAAELAQEQVNFQQMYSKSNSDMKK